MRSIATIILLVVMAVNVAACGKARAKPSVWEMYDVRHPVPADSAVPMSRANQYDRYIDNDAYYTIPGDISNYDPD